MSNLAIDFNADLLQKQLECELSLRDYIAHLWPVLEPGRVFKRGWSIDAVCEFLEAVSRKEIRRGLINVPPGCMKSLTTEVFWPTWEWGPLNLPHMRYVSASYSESLTVRDNRKARIVIQSPEFQELWGDRFVLQGDQNAKQKFENDKTGFKLATSVGGVGTGERGDRFIIDDPHNVKQAESEKIRQDTLQWFTEVVPTRINDPEESVILIIMQRVHEKDVSGLILAEELGYEHLMLPMEFEPERKCYVTFKPRYMPDTIKPETVLWDKREKAWRTEADMRAHRRAEETISEEVEEAEIAVALPTAQERYPADPRSELGELLWPERFTRRHIEEDLKPTMRSIGGTYAEAGQLQQRPTPRGGGMFQRGDFQFIEPSEVQHLKGKIVRGWDLAASEELDAAASSSTKGMIDQYKRLIILDNTWFKKLPGAVKKEVEDTAEQDGLQVQQDLPQDPGQAGKAQKYDYIAGMHGKNITFSPETGDKTTRATPVATQAEAKNIYLVRGPWNDAFISEHCSFPNADEKDRVDATSRMYMNLSKKTQQSFGGTGAKVLD